MGSSIMVSSMHAVICVILARGMNQSGARVVVAVASIHREALIDLARALLVPLRQSTAWPIYFYSCNTLS